MKGGGDERRLLTAMVVDRAVLAAIAGRWEKGLFSSRWANLAGGWCVEFFRKYRKAPGKEIESLFDQWAQDGSKDKETVKLVETFLSGLSGEYSRLRKDSSPEFVLDLANQYFNRVRLQNLKDEIEADLSVGDVQKAKAKVDGFKVVEVGAGSGIDVFQEQAAVIGALQARGESLIEYPEALKNFFANSLERDAFICFMGKEKVGKTWNLVDLAYRGATQGRRVAFFEVGDMSQAQIMRRFMVRAAKHPLLKGRVKYPIGMEPGDPPEITYKEFDYDEDLDEKKALAAFQKVTKKLNLGYPTLKLSCHPNSSINVHGINAIAEGWVRDGWNPDVIVIDYADIIAPINGAAETRDQINATWKALRAMSQSFHCLVVTATQTDAASYRAETVDRSNFSEDKRKLAHVTGMIGINQTEEEHTRGVTRLNWVVLRELEFSESKCVHLAGCLALGNPAVHSTF